MPHLSLPISPGGPILDCFIGVSNARAEALRRANQAVPVPIQVRALVDTGASCTGIDPSILSTLGIVSTGTTQVHTPSTTSGQPHVANQFDVSLILNHPMISRTFMAVPVIESALLHQGIQALISRDILAFCLLTYDGQAGIFCLGF